MEIRCADQVVMRSNASGLSAVRVKINYGRYGMEHFDHTKEPDELYVMWTSGDREVALKMVFMYTLNSRLKAWWPHVTLIIWGPSAKLLTEDEELQEKVRTMLHAGVAIVACKACSDAYGASAFLEGLGVEVKYMGQPLTQLLKDRKTLITF